MNIIPPIQDGAVLYELLLLALMSWYGWPVPAHKAFHCTCGIKLELGFRILPNCRTLSVAGGLILTTEEISHSTLCSHVTVITNNGKRFQRLCSSQKVSLLTAQFSSVGHIWDFLCLLVMFYQLLDVSNYFITADSKQRLIHVDFEWLFAITRVDLF